MEEDWSSRQALYLNPFWDRGLYRLRALLAKQRFFTETYTNVHFHSCTQDVFRVDHPQRRSIPPAYVAWRAGTTTQFLAPIDCYKIPALNHLSFGKGIDY
jgi:hypothetical protein